MPRWFVNCLTASLFFNAVLVVFRPHRTRDDYHPPVHTANTTTTDHSSRKVVCNCTKQNSEEIEPSLRTRPTVNYSIVATETPQVWTGESLSRLGSQLTLDYPQKCPKGSLMLDTSWRNFIPEHLDCPTLFLVGARKAGTTSLYTYLSRHPKFEGIHLDRGPMAGETFYFSAHYNDKNWGWSRYMKLFDPVQSYMTGDSSVGNLVNCDVPERIWQSCGKQAKIVILLRDPLTRFLSNFLMRTHKGIRYYNNNTKASTIVEVELQSFISAALRKHVDFTNIERYWGQFRCLFNPSRNLVFEGLYYIHVMNWLCNFPPENILILNSEEFFKKTSVILEQVIRFLGLAQLDRDTIEFITSAVYNKGSGPKHSHHHFSDLDRKKLMAIYKHSNRALLSLLGWGGAEWSMK